MNKRTVIYSFTVLAISLFVVVSVAWASSVGGSLLAHTSDSSDSQSTGVLEDDSHEPMMGHMMNMMHSGTQGHMQAMSVEEMDQDGDGVCDFCGMSVEHCQKMTDMHQDDNGCPMHTINN